MSIHTVSQNAISLNLCGTSQLGLFHQRQSRSQCPSELDTLHLLGDQQFPILLQLVPEPKERVHECQIEAVFWPVLEFVKCELVTCESFFPDVRSSTDVFGELDEVAYFEALVA